MASERSPQSTSGTAQSRRAVPQEFGYRRPTWTQELLILVLAERVEISISVSAMSRLLRRSGIGLKRPKPIVSCPWKKARRTRRLRAIQRLVENLPADEVVLYVDEVDIHLNPKIGPDWTKRGRQKKVLTPGCNEKRYLAGAWNPKTRRLIYVEGERKNSLLFLELLHTLATKVYPNAKRIHLILDNYGIHDSLQVRLAMKSAAAEKLELHFLPPYCPDHNRIERIWKDLHDNVTRNHRCTTMDELMAEVRSYLHPKPTWSSRLRKDMPHDPASRNSARLFSCGSRLTDRVECAMTSRLMTSGLMLPEVAGSSGPSRPKRLTRPSRERRYRACPC